MSNSKSRPILDMSNLALDCRWDEAIGDAEKAIFAARERIKHLKRSIETFKRLRDSGTPFPGEGHGQSDMADR